MPEVPKIVHDRLRAGLPGSTVPETAHPDPDVLTAFAEQALSAAEREGVLQHLARCGECRELVALSIPPMESSRQPVAGEERESTVSVARTSRAETGRLRPWCAWPGLRWAALAAGVAVAGGILLIHPGKPAAVPEAKQQPASTAPRPEEIIAKQTDQELDSAVNPTKSEKKAAPTKHPFSRDKELQFSYSATAPADKVMARGRIETRAANKDLAAGAATGGAMSAAPIAPPPAPPGVPSASEMVEVTAASGPVTTEEARNDLPLTARQLSDLPVNGRQVSDLSISKAKAAKTESKEASAQQRSESVDTKQVTTETTAHRQRAAAAGMGMNTLAAKMSPDADKGAFPQPTQYAAQWAIHGNDLQRSLDSGAVWKVVLHSDRPLLCYTVGGSELWVGGKGGDLFHSANGGVTWNDVHPSAQEQTLVDDVTHIDIHSPSQIVFFTSNNQSWSTADGGKTWAKK